MTDAIQQQLITARKNQILDAAAVVFADKGFHPTTIRDIAKHAGIADGTIYNYFSNKPALLMGIFDRMREKVMQQAAPIAPDSIELEAFVRMFVYHPLMALKADNFALFRIVISEMMVNEEIRSLYYQQILQPTLMGGEIVFQQFAVQHSISPHTARLIVRSIAAMIMGLMIEYIMGDETLAAHWDELPDTLTQLILNGLQMRDP